ncbi:tRNA maturation protein LHP1, partial [Ascoidea rubescens DSM 1968]
MPPSYIPFREVSAPPTELTSKIQAAIIKQVEFYFSDANLNYDRYLLNEVRSNAEGWVKIELIASWNRMKKFRPVKNIVDSIKKSTALVVSDNDLMIRRKTPFVVTTESYEKSYAHTLYVEGFPTLIKKMQIFQSDLESYFGQFGEVAIIKIRKKKFDKSF